jgi:hypothetical protein
MKKFSASVATLAAVGASLLGVLALAGPATAKKKCQLVSKNKLAPHLVSPCNGATVKRGATITFTVFDSDSQARRYHPNIALDTRKHLSHGHLVNQVDGNGIYDELKPLKGHPNTWIEVSKHAIYPTWWDNHPGTVYVQIQQIDSRAGRGDIIYSPIVAIHVQ